MNVIFANIKGIQASELVNLMNLFTTSFDDVINYDDFLKILYKFGDMPVMGGQQPPQYSGNYHQQDFSPYQQ